VRGGVGLKALAPPEWRAAASMRCALPPCARAPGIRLAAAHTAETDKAHTIRDTIAQRGLHRIGNTWSSRMRQGFTLQVVMEIRSKGWVAQQGFPFTCSRA